MDKSEQNTEDLFFIHKVILSNIELCSLLSALILLPSYSWVALSISGHTIRPYYEIITIKSSLHLVFFLPCLHFKLRGVFHEDMRH